MLQRTFPLSSAPYGGFSSAPWRAPSLSPPRRSCRICPASDCTSAVETGATAGVSVLRSKLAGESGSNASILIVRQLSVAIVVDMRRGRGAGSKRMCVWGRRCGRLRGGYCTVRLQDCPQQLSWGCLLHSRQAQNIQYRRFLATDAPHSVTQARVGTLNRLETDRNGAVGRFKPNRSVRGGDPRRHGCNDTNAVEDKGTPRTTSSGARKVNSCRLQLQ